MTDLRTFTITPEQARQIAAALRNEAAMLRSYVNTTSTADTKANAAALEEIWSLSTRTFALASVFSTPQTAERNQQ